LPTVFIAGSIAISRLHPLVEARIEKAVHGDCDIVVGDADGADASIQHSLKNYGARRVTVYCSGDTPRNNVGNWRVESVHPSATPGTRAWFTAKDLEMANTADYGLMIWDSRSTGTLSNVIELLAGGKKSVIFVNKMKAFASVSDVDGLERLIAVMSPTARGKADEKMLLEKRVAALRNEQLAMPL
jgi:hypothetical protein